MPVLEEFTDSSYSTIPIHSSFGGRLPTGLDEIDFPYAGHESRTARRGLPTRVLLVGGGSEARDRMRGQIGSPQWSVRDAETGAEALEKLLEEACDLMLVSPYLPDLEVGEFQCLVQAQFPGIRIVPLGGASMGDPGLPAAATPPPPRPGLAAVTSQPQGGWQGMIGTGAAMGKVYRAAELVARRNTTVLIGGESGTGKDLLARGIHRSGPRARQPFVVINCAAIPEALLEAELFGYTKGAFTGASQSKIGRVHAADGGTLFLDEIGEMPLPLQSKILRFLEQGEVQRIGGTDTLRVDCRVVAATNAELKKLVTEGRFREDLYYRLAVFPITLPPLRERMEDIDALVANFLKAFDTDAAVHPAARQRLIEHAWPGNVRELRNVVERATLYADGRGEILAEDIVL